MKNRASPLYTQQPGNALDCVTEINSYCAEPLKPRSVIAGVDLNYRDPLFVAKDSSQNNSPMSKNSVTSPAEDSCPFIPNTLVSHPETTALYHTILTEAFLLIPDYLFIKPFSIHLKYLL